MKYACDPLYVLLTLVSVFINVKLVSDMAHVQRRYILQKISIKMYDYTCDYGATRMSTIYLRSLLGSQKFTPSVRGNQPNASRYSCNVAKLEIAAAAPGCWLPWCPSYS